MLRDCGAGSYFPFARLADLGPDRRRHLSETLRPWLRQLLHRLWRGAIERLELRIVVEEFSRHVVDEGFSRGAFRQNDLVVLRLDVEDGKSLAKLGRRDAPDGADIDQRARLHEHS